MLFYSVRLQMSCRVIRVERERERERRVNLDVIMTPPPVDGRIEFLAAQPSERRASFTGSGMPLPDEAVALQGPKNRGTATATVNNGLFRVILPLGFPGVYYVGMGSEIAPPTLHVIYRPYADGPRVWCRAPISKAHPFIHHRSSLNYLYGTQPPPLRSQEAQDTLLFRTRY
jgi:hypothetical protein